MGDRFRSRHFTRHCNCARLALSSQALARQVSSARNHLSERGSSRLELGLGEASVQTDVLSDQSACTDRVQCSVPPTDPDRLARVDALGEDETHVYEQWGHGVPRLDHAKEEYTRVTTGEDSVLHAWRRLRYRGCRNFEVGTVGTGAQLAVHRVQLHVEGRVGCDDEGGVSDHSGRDAHD